MQVQRPNMPNHLAAHLAVENGIEAQIIIPLKSCRGLECIYSPPGERSLANLSCLAGFRHSAFGSCSANAV